MSVRSPATHRSSPRFPAAYGAGGGEGSEPMAWADVEQRLAAAPNYWLSTVTPGGRPHARPVDGVWVDGALCFGGSPETRWVRNLQHRPELTAHLASAEDVVVLEGTVELVSDPEHPLVGPSTAASVAKYPQYFGTGAPPFRPFWSLRPDVAYAWSLAGFPTGAARWTFERRP